MISANYGGYVLGQMPKNANVICEGSLIKTVNLFTIPQFFVLSHWPLKVPVIF